MLLSLATRRLYSALEINAYSSEPIDNSRKFNLDLAGPRFFFCSDSMIDLILKTGINQYMEFKSVDASYVSDAVGKLENVPDSRSAIFKHRTIIMMVTDMLRIILYAIALANYDQDNVEVCKDVINTKSGINHLALYHSSMAVIPHKLQLHVMACHRQKKTQRHCLKMALNQRIVCLAPWHAIYNYDSNQSKLMSNIGLNKFTNANGAMIYPILVKGNFLKPFRRAAVKGCIYVLRMPVVAVLLDKDNGTYKGVKLVSGQELFSPQLIVAPSFTFPSTLGPSPAQGQILVMPKRRFVTYLSAMCDNVEEGKKLINAAINALFSVPIPGNSEKSAADSLSEHIEENPVCFGMLCTFKS
ncbi:UNVERIFIED_CONTAM: Rab escort protein 1 [Sesamum calycinum]|uniref:Rab escort protein 1 n=1 Tax=Sesamum calycinum TaxID=2727403 RepID=A0AAW2KEB0_9LAMI